MPDVWLFILLALASYRVTRLVTMDKITEPIFGRVRWWFERRWYEKHDGGSDTHFNSKIAFMLSCPWCLGFWVSGAGTLLVSLAYGLDYPILTWFALSTVVGFLGRFDSE
jgi:hypothetical protein